ncbi:MAG: phage tail tape measure protein [Lachnospiraceae bacterium]|nr:phage tail tape measure protein [Lachnospiraceae bacterium]
MAETIRIEIPIETVDKTDPDLSNVTKKFEKMEKAANSAESSAKKAGQTVSAFDKQAQKTEKSLSKWAKEKYEILLEAKDKISPILSTLGGGLKSFAGKTWSVTMRAIDLITSPVRGIINLLKNPIFQAGAVLGVSIGLKDTIETYKNFEAAMSQVQAISGATGNELERLTAKAKEMGATTKFTATESAEAFNYMAMAGWKTEDMLEGIEGILNLAAASGADLATTSDIVTDALTAFNMQANEAGHFADVLAAASANANTNVTMMGETFKYAAAMAGTLNYSIEDVSLMAGLMANSGIKATMSGTALNMIFTRLSTNTGNARDALSDLGIEYFDAAGNARDLSDVMEELRAATEGMNDEQKSSLANTIAGTQAQKGLLAILNASEEDYRKLKDAIENADGAAENMAGTMMDNLSGSITLLQSAVDGVKISFGERLSPYVRSLADWLTDQMPAIEQGLDNLMDWVDTKVDRMKRKLAEITGTDEWQNANFFGKAKILWDEFIVEPFQEWWSTTGKGKFIQFSEKIGNAIGTGLKVGIMTLLGIDIEETVDEGASIGASFARGFSEGFDFDAISEKIWNGLGNLVKNASKLLPGGESADLSSVLSAALLYKIATPFMGVGKGALGMGKALFGTNAATGSSLVGAFLGSAAAGTGLLGNSAMFAINLGAGNLAGGASLSAGALSGLGLGAGAGGIAAGATVISGGIDLYKAIKSDDEDYKNAYGESSAWKFGGVAAGAAAGAALGSVIPGLGTAVGALIGAGVGGIAGWIRGNQVKKEYEENVEKMQAEAAKARKVFQATGMDIDKVRFKNQALVEAMNDSEVTAEEFAAMFQESCVNVMNEAFGDIHLSLTEVKKLASEITFGNMKQGINEFASAVNEADLSLSSLESAVSSMKKQNWKVGLGMELTESEKDSYKASIDNFISAAQKYIDDNHYEATVALQLLTNGDVDTSGLDNAYGILRSQVTELATNLQDYITEALEDNKIEASEILHIEELQQQITDITNMINNAKSEAQLQAIGIKYSGAELDAESFLAMQEELAAYAQQAQATLDEALTLTLTNQNLRIQMAENDKSLSPEEKMAIIDDANRIIEEATSGYYAQLNDVSVRVNDFSLDAIATAWDARWSELVPYFQGTAQEKLQQALNNVMISHPDVANWTSPDVISWFGLDKIASDAETQTVIADMLIRTAQANTDATREQLIDSYKDCIPTADEIYAAIDWSSFTFNDQDALMRLIDPTWGQGESWGVSQESKAKSFAEYYGANWESVAQATAANIERTMKENLDPDALRAVMDQYFSDAVPQMSSLKIPTFDEIMAQYGPVTDEYYHQLLAEYLVAGQGLSGQLNTGVTTGLSDETSLYRTAAESAINDAFSNPFNVTADINVTPNFTGLPTYSNILLYNSMQGHAKGGYVSGGPQLSWLAEEGWGEFIIPTNPGRRSEALSLYMQAGRALGIAEHAEGGYVGGSNPSDIAQGYNFLTEAFRNEARAYNETTEGNYGTSAPVGTGNGNESYVPSVQVSVNMTPEFNISGENGQTEEDIVQTIRRHMKEIADELGGEIADKLGEVFSNMPVREA